MGTRHLICVYLDGEYQIAQYGQFDGYPGGAGAAVLTFAHVLSHIKELVETMTPGDYDAAYRAFIGAGLGNAVSEPLGTGEFPDAWEVFAEQVRRCRVMPDEELAALWKKYGADESGMVGIEDADRFGHDFPSLVRETGADILKMVATQPKGEPLPIRRNLEFAADSLFCEFLWLIDLDNRTFEGYAGFQKTPLQEGERFASLPPTEHVFGGTYYPVRQYVSYPLDNLPPMYKFLQDWEARERMENPENFEDEDIPAGPAAVEPAAVAATSDDKVIAEVVNRQAGNSGRGARKL